MKKKLFCFLMLLIPILSGCNYKELNNLSIVDVMGIDYINNNYVVTIKVISTNNNNNNEKNENLDENVYSASGKNISDAISNLNLVLPKKIYLNHLELLIISKNVATNKLNNITNYFINNNNVSKNFSVLLSLEDTSKIILEQKELLSSYSYGNIIGSIENSSLMPFQSLKSRYLQN